MSIIIIPTVAASRTKADELFDELGGNLDESVPLRVDSRDLDMNTDSFLAQLVFRAREAGIHEIDVLGGGLKWLADVEKEAQAQGMTVRPVVNP